MLERGAEGESALGQGSGGAVARGDGSAPLCPQIVVQVEGVLADLRQILLGDLQVAVLAGIRRWPTAVAGIQLVQLHPG